MIWAMDLAAVRTFVAIADYGQFQAAADELSITQQGASRRIGPAAALRDFHRAHPEAEIEVVTLTSTEAALAGVLCGTLDATVRAITVPPGQLPDGVQALRVLDEAHQLLTGPEHALADAKSVALAQLAGHKIWIPGIVAGTEWAAYYQELAGSFGLTIEASGPNFGTDPMLDVLAESATLASLIGEQTRLLWPADYDLRRVPVTDPAPVYPYSLAWRAGNPHPALAALRDFLACRRASPDPARTWLPSWAR